MACVLGQWQRGPGAPSSDLASPATAGENARGDCNQGKSMADATVHKLMEDLKAIAADAEALLAATAGDASERVREARARAGETLGRARSRLESFEAEVKARASAAAGEVDRYVHDNPWPAIAAAAGVGVLIGILVARR
jgi:ElaB/YqjD/DUF883 family membrane-anchored ribosome-binding protein